MNRKGTTLHLLSIQSEFSVTLRCVIIHARIVNKPGLFCAEPKSPPVLAVVPNADVPNPPVVPKPASVRIMSSN